jgi:hypothetical protein
MVDLIALNSGNSRQYKAACLEELARRVDIGEYDVRLEYFGDRPGNTAYIIHLTYPTPNNKEPTHGKAHEQTGE